MMSLVLDLRNMIFKWLEIWHRIRQRILDFLNTDMGNRAVITQQGLMLQE